MKNCLLVVYYDSLPITVTSEREIQKVWNKHIYIKSSELFFLFIIYIFVSVSCLLLDFKSKIKW